IARDAPLALLVDGVRDRLAQDVEFTFEGVLVELLLALADEHLHVLRLGRLHRLAEGGIVGGHVAPAEEGEPLARDHLRVDVADDLPPARLGGQEQLADGVFTGRGQGEACFLRLLGEELVRDLHQDARAVAHARVGADGATVLEVAQDAQTVLDDLVRLAALDVGDEADAAGILVQRRVVEALRQRRARVERGRARKFGVASGELALKKTCARLSLSHFGPASAAVVTPPAYPSRPRRLFRRVPSTTVPEKGAVVRPVTGAICPRFASRRCRPALWRPVSADAIRTALLS